MSTIRIIDFETTGMPPAAICEVGWQDVLTEEPDKVLFSRSGGTLVNPARVIQPEASAVHHIIDADVQDAPTIEPVFLQLMDGADIFAAHNAAFEQEFFAGGGKPWICTLKAARRVWPEAPGHSNQTLRYWRNLPANREIAAPAHRAYPDAYVTGLLLCDLLAAGATVDQMIQWTKEPSLLPRVTFGKHRGKAWSELPVDYLKWLTDKSEMDEDTKFTARHHLKKADA